MTITSSQQIAQLKACGVETLVVSIEAEDIEEGTVLESDITDEPAVPAEKETASVQPVVPFDEELPAARQIYQAVKIVIQDAMHDVRFGRAINVDAVSKIVSDMMDSVFRNPDALPVCRDSSDSTNTPFTIPSIPPSWRCPWDGASGSTDPRCISSVSGHCCMTSVR